ncbi:MAG TPA: plastocyanin/azurin family copper-binding protein [Gemmatimonadales bacterium]|jgi:plastocyanin|nr:plastocyanin/azurin family copper-binding protein [Gemmatimonadales bacterium]
MTTSRLAAAAGLAAAMGLLPGCGSSDRVAPDPTTLVLSKPTENSGDGQVGVAGVQLPDSLRVVVTRDGQPVSGVRVIWFTTEGTVNPATSVTGPDGLTATTWTPMPLFAEQFMLARIDADGGDTTAFTAIATPDPAAPNTILVGPGGGNTFEPANLTIPVGGTVNWFWPEGSTGHNIVANDGASPPHSGALANWPKWHVFRFTVPGVYRYYCAAHGGVAGLGMSGTITVEEVTGE